MRVISRFVRLLDARTFCNPDEVTILSIHDQVKFSYANVAAGSTGPIPWTHITSQNDLFVVIDPFETSSQTGPPERRYTFKVVQEPDTKEIIDLFSLATEAKKAIQQAQNPLFPRQQPSITAIVKTPCIALRYPLQDGRVRRFQVRYAREGDFHGTLRIFTHMKVPYIQAGSIPHYHSAILPQPQPATNASTHSSLGPMHNRSIPTPYAVSLQPSVPICATVYPQGEGRTSLAASKYTASQERAPWLETLPTACGRSNNAEIFPASTVIKPAQCVPTPIELVPPNNAIPSSSAPAISTYVPKPSTAPISTALTPSIDLPPKRDLPFGRKKISSSMPTPEVHQDDRENILPTANKSIPAGTAGKSTAAQSNEQSINTKTRKRAAAKPKKATATKKAKPTTSRRKETATESQSEMCTLTDETQPNALNNNILGPPAVQAQIDTQDLLKKAESITTAKHASTKGQVAITSAFPTTSSTDNTSEDEINPLKQNLHGTKTPAHQPPTPLIQAQTAHATLTALLSDPDFAQPAFMPNLVSKRTPRKAGEQANADEGVGSESEPSHESTAQYQADLETWMVSIIQDDDFTRLCQMLEPMWQRIFVKY